MWTQACSAGGGVGAAFGSRCQLGIVEPEQAAEDQEPAGMKDYTGTFTHNLPFIPNLQPLGFGASQELC